MPSNLTRRRFGLVAGSLFAWGSQPRLSRATTRDPRFLVVLLRGGVDGLGVVAPIGDPDWASLRGDRGLSLDGSHPAIRLDPMFAINSAMPHFARFFSDRQLLIAHALATPYRERSHFDAQDVLESGMPTAGVRDSGWLNRALAALAPGDQVATLRREVLTIGPVPPLIVRGAVPVISWAPSRLPAASDDTLMRVLGMYQHTDPVLARTVARRADLIQIAKTGVSPADQTAAAATGENSRLGQHFRNQFQEALTNAARFMSQPSGPRIGAITLDGWDTHADEGALSGRLSIMLDALDGAMAGFAKGMQNAWSDTVVAIVTEFGRTVRINGTHGTDHGLATIAFLLGGAVNGGRVMADWPGLRPADLHEGRDLRSTLDLRSIMKGVLAEHLHIDPARIDQAVFPNSAEAPMVRGLVR